MRYQRHVFVCVNERPPDDPKGSCLAKGSPGVRDLLKEELKKRGLNKFVRANNAGCLDACSYGVSMVIYPDGIWYGGVTKEDVQEIVERTIIGGEVIDRLVVKNPNYYPESRQFPPLKIE